MNWFTNLFLSFGLKEKIKQLVNIVIDVAIKEGKGQIDETSAIPKDQKDVAKLGVDMVAAQLKSLINERLDKL